MKYPKPRGVAMVLLFVFFLWTPATEAVTAAPVVHTHARRDGSVVRYRMYGDEFLNYMRDSDGSMIAFGDDGDLYLADWISEQNFNSASASGAGIDGVSDAAARSAVPARFVVPTGRKPAANAIGAQNAPAVENRTNAADTRIPEYILDYARQKRTDRDRARRRQSGNSAQNSVSFAPPSNPGDGVKERKVLIIYVNFKDQSGLSMYNNGAPTEDVLHKLIFDESEFGSVAHYYKTVTDGMAKILPAKENYGTTDDGVVFVTLDGPHGRYGNTNDVRDKIIIPAILKADSYLDMGVFDVNKKDNVITSDELSIGVMVHGGEAAFLGSNSAAPAIWAHAYSEYEDILEERKKGYEIKSYFAVGAFMSNTAPDLLTAGTIAHEMGHDAFGFVDVYDYGEGGDGDGKVPAIGNWSLMGSGNWGRKSAYEREGSCPTPIDAYNLLYIKPAYEKSAAAEAEHFSLTGPARIMKLKNDVKPSQYFLLQPRGYAGYDLGFLPGGAKWTPSSGLLIYHVDEAIEEDIPNPNDWNEHPLVDIEEAHGGTQNLQTTGKQDVNSGNPNDLFYGSKNTFSGTTDPNSNLYDSDSSTGQNTRSAIKVYNISSTIYNEGSPEGTFAVAFDVIKEPVTDDDGGDSGGGCDAGVFALLGLAGLPVIFLTKAVIPIAYRSMYNMRRTIVRKIHK